MPTITKKQFRYPLVFFIASIISLNAISETKKASDVFKKWLTWQRVFEPMDLIGSQEAITQQCCKNFKNTYKANIALLRPHYIPFLQQLTNNQINENGHRITNLMQEPVLTTLKTIYQTVENDMPSFITMLDTLGLNTSASTISQEPVQATAEANIALATLLFGQSDASRDSSVLFSVANKFFDFCFSSKTFPIFQEIISKKKYHPTAHLLFSTMQHHFSAIGWTNWSAQCLKNLKQEAAQGKKIVYLAGGSDIYQLITNGIYNIKIIDPQLPSQPKYYAEEWDWVMRGKGFDGGIGDQLIFENHGIVMKRTGYQESPQAFKARLADGQILSINPSKTVWTITNQQGQQLGTYTLERRFVAQEDFVPDNNQILLMSFNELFFVSLPDQLNGWQIEPSKFDHTLTMAIKQLHRPISKEEICNVRIASYLTASDLKFISLGSCIN